MVFIPQKLQILVGKNEELGSRYAADKINREMERVCGELEIGFLDTYPALLAAARDEPVFYPTDLHLTPRGYRLVGRLLADHLLRDELVPTSPREAQVSKLSPEEIAR